MPTTWLAETGGNSSRAQLKVGADDLLGQTLLMDEHQLQADIRQLFPDGVAVHYSPRCPADAELHAEELAYTRDMVDKRLLEFTHGRHCARQAMQALDIHPEPVRKRPDRSPAWPVGLVGTITHTGDHAAAAVAVSKQFVSLGMDMEKSEPLETESINLILRPEEHSDDDGTHGKLLFSIKEAIYKCIHPVVHTYVDFQEMQVDLSGAAGTFGAIPHTNNFEAGLIAGLQGRYLSANGLIVSCAWISTTG
jgi:4'-phosphopantetheinyl transferase EntD